MGERPKLWSFDRKTEVEAVDRATSNQEYRELCYRVIDAVLEIREKGQVRPENLDAFAEAVECSYEWVFSSGGRRLSECSYFVPEAGQRLLDLMSSPKWRVRLNTVAIMDYRPREDILLLVLRKGLEDQSAKVRKLAVGKILGLKLLQLLGAMETRSGVEKDAETLEYLNQTINWLQGKPAMMDGKPMWFVWCKDGHSTTLSEEDPAKSGHGI